MLQVDPDNLEARSLVMREQVEIVAMHVESSDLVSIVGDLRPPCLRPFEIRKLYLVDCDFALHAMNNGGDQPRRGWGSCNDGDVRRNNRNIRRIFTADDRHVLVGT